MDKSDHFEPDEINVKELTSKFKMLVVSIVKKWRILLYFSLFGLLIGVLFSLLEKPDYKAISTFVLEESSHGGLGLSQYSGLASMAGIDLGSGSDKGLFQGDNILELYRSRRMIEKTLLTKGDVDGKKRMLVDMFLKDNYPENIWWKKEHAAELAFNTTDSKFSRFQDSILREITKYINKHVLNVSKPDKKLSIISVEVDYKDETFAELFNHELVQNVNDFYVKTQTIKTLQNVKILQHQADSVRLILNSSLGKVAETTDINPNPNPTLHSLQVPIQKRQIDVQASSAIYTEIVKNLELAKISLRQETPLIQIIDEPILTLENDKTGVIKAGLTGLVSCFFLSILYLLGARLYVYVKNA